MIRMCLRLRGRPLGGDIVIVTLNMSASAQSVKLDLKAAGVAASASMKVMLRTAVDSAIAADGTVKMEPYSVVVAELGREACCVLRWTAADTGDLALPPGVFA